MKFQKTDEKDTIKYFALFEKNDFVLLELIAMT
jgi:hypothetical protein